MKDYSFVEIVISGDSHVIISADQQAYDTVARGLEGAFEEHILEGEYRANFIRKIEAADDTWFPARILVGDKTPLFYIRASRQKTTNMIRLIIVSVDELLEDHYKLIRDSASYKAQLDLYEDVYFEYDPDTEMVNVFNTEMARFDAGEYMVNDFEQMLCTGIPGKSQKAVRGFISQMKAKTGRFSARVDSNVLNDGSGYTVSQLEGSYVFFDENSERVVGHIHVGNGRGKIVAASIKHDSLTGLVDKSDITRIAQERIDDRGLQGTTLAVVDIDFFKHVNDTYGHQFGDTVIKRVADIIATEVGNSGIAGRFGGDEFLIVFYNIEDEESLREHLRRIKQSVRASFPDKGVDENTPLTLSIGTATYSKDADNYDEVFMLADYCLYIAKDKGRNRYVIYTPSKHGSLDVIRDKTMSTQKINERGELSYGDILIKMFDLTLHGQGAPIEKLMDEFASTFIIPHLALFAGEPFEMRYSTGTEVGAAGMNMDALKGFLNSDTREMFMAGRDFIVVNKIDFLPPQAASFKAYLKEMGVYSFMFIRIKDQDGLPAIVLISSVGKYIQWNEAHYKYYRAFADVLACYHLTAGK
jgi:diguanylate cyclase (GGDEF)-like protein